MGGADQRGNMTIDALADGASRLARDYLQKPPLPVLREAASAYRRVSGLLRGGHQSLRQTRDLYVIAGQLLAFLSWVSSDIGQSAAAEAHARAGWIMAEQADHDPLRAIVLIAQGKNAYWEGRFQEAADLARRGLECAPPTTARVLLASQLGDARQADGDIAGALEAQNVVKRARDEVTSETTRPGYGRAGGLGRPTTQWVFTCGPGMRPEHLPRRKRLSRPTRLGNHGPMGHGRRSGSGRESRIFSRDGWMARRANSHLSSACRRSAGWLRSPPGSGRSGCGSADRRYQGSTEAAELRQQIADYRAHAVTARALPPGQS